MTATRDKFGRPIVVVTGMGVVTSLGAGKSDNWAKLSAGESGIRTITRFPTDGLKTTMAELNPGGGVTVHVPPMRDVIT
jgi:3-oxoacyl-[acyl-carrier-protein] synthase II